MNGIYWRCNSGHYFSSTRCPFDGWSSGELIELTSVAGKLTAKGADPSIANLRSEGTSETALKRAIIVEFGSERSAFDALAPDYYVINGESTPLHKVGPDFR
jgi:hypothetical protein